MPAAALTRLMLELLEDFPVFSILRGGTAA
jgi:hypothetical protein